VRGEDREDLEIKRGGGAGAGWALQRWGKRRQEFGFPF